MTLKSLAAVCTTLTLAIGATVYLAAQDAQAEKTLIANERAVNQAVAKGDLATFKQHVAAEGWSMDGMSGRMSVADFVKLFPQMTKDMKIESWDISDFKTVWVDANCAVLTYKWTGKGMYQGQPIPSPTWSSTVWTKRNGKWTAVFHQESAGAPAPAGK
jgi:hypothetical protein